MEKGARRGAGRKWEGKRDRGEGGDTRKGRREREERERNEKVRMKDDLQVTSRHKGDKNTIAPIIHCDYSISAKDN